MRRSGEIQCRVRLKSGEDIALGPGKMELLQAIRDSGSISAAARSMGMSYRRAWMLVETMNRCFSEPLVTTATGGRAGGGATVTSTGEAALAAYGTMMADVRRIADKHLEGFLKTHPLADH